MTEMLLMKSRQNEYYIILIVLIFLSWSMHIFVE